MPEGNDSDSYDLFVSYAHSDNRGDFKGWVEHLVAAIQDEHKRFSPVPLKVFLDLEDIHTMDDWEHRILHGLRHSRVMLAVLSPRYFQSAFCRREWKTYCNHEVGRAMLGEGIAPIYIVKTPDFDDDAQAALDDWLTDLKKRQYLDVQELWTEGIHALQREDVRKRMELLDQRINEKLDRAERFHKSPTTVPPHNRNFVGRREELRQLRETLALGRVGAITAVHDLAGIGKTALAFEYSHAFAHEYPGGRFLIAAAGVDDLRVPILNLAEKKGVTLTVEERKDLDAAFARVRAAFERDPSPSLLVLDNVDNPALLAPARRDSCLPSRDKVHVLVTTRLEPQRLPGLECLALDALPEADALHLLEKHRPFADDAEWKAAARIVRRLGGHALAVEVVAVYLWQNAEVSYAAYLARLEKEGLGAVEGAGADELVQLSRHPQKLLGPLLEPTLAGLSPAERLAVEYAALLPAEAIALPWLRALVGQAFPEMVEEPEPGHPDPWERLKRRLLGLRLLTGTDEPKLLRMHRLVQDVVQARLAETRAAKQKALVEHAGERGGFLWEGWVNRANRWEIEPLRAYAVLLMEKEELAGASLANWVHGPLQDLGNLAEARTLMQRALAIEEKAFDPDHPTLATSYTNLALVERDLGNLAEARTLMQRALAIKEKAYDPNHPTLATSYNNLAMVERDLGNLTEARTLMQRALAIDEKAYDPDHPTLAARYNNLAWVEQDLGNLAEARTLIQRALAINEKAYDPDHPTLTRDYNNLATVEKVKEVSRPKLIVVRPQQPSSSTAKWRELVAKPSPNIKGLKSVAAFFCRIVGFILAGMGWTLVNKPLQTDDASTITLVKALSLLGGSLGIFLLIYAKRLSTPHALTITKRDSRTPILLLRAFDEDRLPALISESFFLTYTREINLQEILVSQFSRCGPVIAIGRPGEAVPPLGAARFWVSDAHWQEAIKQLLQESQLVVMIMGQIHQRAGLKWEVENIFGECDLRKVVLVMPPIDEEDVKSRWEEYRILFRDLLPPYQGGEIAATFDSSGNCLVAYLATRKWLLFTNHRDGNSYKKAIQIDSLPQ